MLSSFFWLLCVSAVVCVAFEMFDVSCTFGMKAVPVGGDRWMYWNGTHALYGDDEMVSLIHFELPQNSHVTRVSKFQGTDDFVVAGNGDTKGSSFISYGTLERKADECYKPTTFNCALSGLIALSHQESREAVAHFQNGIGPGLIALLGRDNVTGAWSLLGKMSAGISALSSMMMFHERQPMSVTLRPFKVTIAATSAHFVESTPTIRPIIVVQDGDLSVDECMAVAMLRSLDAFSAALLFPIRNFGKDCAPLVNCREFREFCQRTGIVMPIPTFSLSFTCPLVFLNINGRLGYKRNLFDVKDSDVASTLFPLICADLINGHYRNCCIDYFNEVRKNYLLYYRDIFDSGGSGCLEPIDLLAIQRYFSKYCLRPLRALVLGEIVDLPGPSVTDASANFGVVDTMSHIYSRISDILNGLTGGVLMTHAQRTELAISEMSIYVDLSLDAAIRRHFFKQALIALIYAGDNVCYEAGGRIIIFSINIELDEYIFELDEFSKVDVFVTLFRVRCRPLFEGALRTAVHFPQSTIDRLDHNEFIHESGFFGTFSSKENALRAAREIIAAHP